MAVNIRRGMAPLVSLVAMIALAGPAGRVFACTPQATMSINPTSGSAGSTTTVTGKSFREGTVEIRWNSMTGPIIARPTGPNFATQVPIPADAQSGVHYIVAISRLDGQVAGSASRPFEVTEPPATTTTDPPQAQSSSPPPTQVASSSGGSSPPPQPGPAPSGNTPAPSAQTVAAPSVASASPTTTKAVGSVTTRTTTAVSTAKGAATTVSTIAEPGAVPGVATVTPDATAATTTTEPDDDDRELAVQPAASQGGWGPRQVAAVFVLSGLLTLGGVAMGRRRRQPKL